MPSSTGNDPSFPAPPTKPVEEPEAKRGGRELAQQAIDNLNRLRQEKEAAKKRESPAA
jgi:hypothetical protein